MRLSRVTNKYSSLTDLNNLTKDIVWTNKYDCPPGHQFNEDGWVETLIPYPKITVSFLPFLLARLGQYELLLQNLLALRLLNNRSHEELESALRNRFNQAYFGVDVVEDIFQKVVEKSRSIDDTSDLPPISEDILQFDTIWFSKDCSEGGKKEIKKVLRNNYISSVRSLMPISSKYKTNDVMTEAEVTKYAVNSYWKTSGLDAKNRTLSAIVEALEEVIDAGVEPTQEVIAQVAGVSVRSIQRYKDMWMLNK